MLHCHTPKPAADGVVVFIHGWNGHRYGTWEKFPEFLYADCPRLDVGMYAYVTGWQRLRVGPSARFVDQAKVLASVIRDELEKYPRVFLIGHSQGALLAKAAITELIAREDQVTRFRLVGLFLMAAAQAGTRWLEWIPGWLNGDTEALKPDSDISRRTIQCFQNRVTYEPGAGPAGRDRWLIPTWAVVPDADAWVSRTSALIGLEDKRIKDVPGSHTSIVKPPDPADAAYAFVRNRIKELLAGKSPATAAGRRPDRQVAAAPAAVPIHGGPSMSTGQFFWTHPDAEPLRSALVNAYGSTRLDRIRILSERAGVDTHEFWRENAAAVDAWRATLEAAQGMGRCRALIGLVLADDSVAAHHDRIRQLSRYLPEDVRSGGGGGGSGSGNGAVGF